MTDTQSIYKGDTAGPWNVGVTRDDGSLETISAPWTCKIRVGGTAIDRAVSDRTADNLRFIAALTPAETLALSEQQYVVAIEIENPTTTPPVRREHHIILTVEKHVVGSSNLPDVAAMQLDMLREDRQQIWDAIAAKARGDLIKEVWRDGRRLVNFDMSLADMRAVLDMFDAEIARREEVAGISERPRRRAIGLLWA